jgi:carboxymethylenebutenolidase
MANENEKLENESLPRRDFVVSVTAGLAAAGTAAAKDMKLTETDVEIKTPDGTADCAFIHPESGAHAAVIIWPDAFGLRPSMRAMARRIATEGYSVLVPNPFYRVGKSPMFEDASNVDFQKDRGKIQPLMASIGADGACEKDAVAYVEWLDKQKAVNKSKKIGTQGYCMGGALVVRTCATVPDRLGAGGSFHGGGLVTKNPNSPHLLAPKINAHMYFGIASNDDAQQPDAKDKLREAFGNKAEIEVYSTCLHGWCVPDMPKSPDGKPIYNKEEADRAWGHLVALYKKNLA